MTAARKRTGEATPLSLVLVPGLLCDGALFAPQIAAFSADRSIAIAALNRGATVDDMAAAILAWAPPRFALAGLSMGGYVALAMAVAAPKRVAGLALLDTAAYGDAPDRVAHRRAQLALADREGLDAVVNQNLPRFLAPHRLTDAPLTGTVRAMAHRVGLPAFHRQQEAIMARPDRRPMLPNLNMPALVLVGAADELTPPAAAEEMAAGLPDATLTIVPDCGHLSTLEAPGSVNAALAGWLNRCA